MHKWSLSDLALDRPVTVSMLLVAVLLLGTIGLAKMPLSFLPADQAARMFVRVGITHTSPEVLEREVIRPLEEQIAGIRDLQRIQTGSGSWGVRINLDFEPGTDVDARKIELRDRIERVRGELPDLVQNIEIGSYSRFDDPVMEIQISSGTDLSEDYYLIEERIVRPIERIRGVARVELDGVSPHELEVSVDLEEAARTGVSLQELGQVVRDARQGRTMGSLRDASRQTGVRSPAAEGDAEHFAELPLRRAAERGGQAPVAGSQTLPAVPVPMATGDDERGFAALGEVAKVSTHPEEQRRGRRLNGRKAINLEIFPAAGSSTVDVTDRIRATMRELDDDASLDGIELLVIRDQGDTIIKTLSDLRDAGIWGGLLGIAVLFLFLHRLRTTLAAAVCIPASVLAACAVLFLRGEELNCVVMLGLVLAVGMLIDNAVVIVEAIAQHARRGVPPLEAARMGAREVGFATIASTLSSVIVFIPLVVGDPHDEMTTYLVPLGTTFAIGLIASLLISQTAAPLLMGHFSVLRGRTTSARPLTHPVLDRVADAYAWIVSRTLRFPRLTVMCGLMLAASAVFPATRLNLRLGGADIKADNLPIRLQIAGSRGMEKIEQIILELESALLAQREALNVDAVSCSFSDHWGNCRLYPAAPFHSERESELFEERVQQVLPDQPGVEYRLGEREFDWRENRDRKVVEFAIKGEDMGELMSLSGEVAAHLAQSLRRGDPDRPEDGGYDTITTPFTEGAQELHVELDGDRLRRLGLSADDIAERVSMAFQGLPLGKISGERGELRLRLSADIGDDADGAGMARLRDLRFPLAEGREVSLGSIAEISLARRPWWIQRVDRQTEVRLKVRFHSDDMGENWDTVSAAMASFTFPPGYTWGRGTMWKTQRESSNEMLINLGLCMLLVYAVMASLFESFLQPFGILLTCLLGCFGAPWALWATGTTLDATAIIGFFILIGIVVNNGIMLIDKVTQLRASGVTREEALRQAGRARLRPILMTVTTTVLGLVPMLIHHPTLAGVYYHAIAIVVTGGLLTSTFITLLFLPAAYTVLEGLARGCTETWRRFSPAPARHRS
jgi:hydrophobic/amphiphilic exporter-1 (mainly G- bacteria), HAE1 family